jgi:N-acyl-D-amino-acid deacylase
MTQLDLVIRNGTVIDGTGADPRSADVGIRGGRIVEVGSVRGSGREEIDATSLLVTPGFVDVHTHYDGQVTWSSQLAPSSVHGVTTIVMGNCGVGFAPCRPHERELLVRVMEGVEDIPGIVLSEGLPWNWETFPEYLDVLAARRYDADIGTQVPHSATRVYAMGRRGAEREPATPADMAAMTQIVQEGILAGALGFSTSRTMNHRLKDGRLAPTVSVGEDELLAIARGLRDIGAGVLQTIDDWADVDAAFAMWQRIVEVSGRPLSFTLSHRGQADPAWQPRLDYLRAAAANGLPVTAQFLCRPIGVLFGLDIYTPFTFSPAYAEIDRLPLADKVRELRRPEVRACILADVPDDHNPQFLAVIRNVENMYRLGDPPNYTPALEDSVGAIARRTGRTAMDTAYDMLLEQDGRAFLYSPASNFAGNTVDSVEAMLKHPNTIVGLGDGGAHNGVICDAGTTTFLLTYWTRDREGDRLSLPTAVKKLTRDTAETVGLADRGVLAPGYRADINVIDYDRLALRVPHIAHDLPAGGKRLMQEADGYVATVVAGEVTYREGQPTGNLPGRLIRGPQPAPSRAGR